MQDREQLEITVEIDGQRHAGRYIVTGDAVRVIELWYEGSSATDRFPAEAEQPGYVEALARELLGRVVRESADLGG